MSDFHSQVTASGAQLTVGSLAADCPVYEDARTTIRAGPLSMLPPPPYISLLDGGSPIPMITGLASLPTQLKVVSTSWTSMPKA